MPRADTSIGILILLTSHLAQHPQRAQPGFHPHAIENVALDIPPDIADRLQRRLTGGGNAGANGPAIYV